MKYALLDNKRIEPQKGIKNAICPVCNEPVTPRCGDMRVHHWAHQPNSNCDPWWENETEWHRQWKNNFPEDYQEYIMYDSKSNEKHVADVRTNTGFVLEFQHSYMPREEQKSREQFYKNMAWVVDARRQYEKFKEHVKQLNHIRTDKTYFYIKIKSWEENPKCFSEKWLNSSVPVIFDFGIHEKDENEKYKNWLWCIFPERYKKSVGYNCNNVLCGVCLKKEKFIEWVCKHKNFLPNLTVPELEKIHKKMLDRQKKVVDNTQYLTRYINQEKWRKKIRDVKNKEQYVHEFKINRHGQIIDEYNRTYNNKRCVILNSKSNVYLLLVEYNFEFILGTIFTTIENSNFHYIKTINTFKMNEKNEYDLSFTDEEELFITEDLKNNLQYIKEKFEPIKRK